MRGQAASFDGSCGCPEGLPECGEVWIEGQTLPVDYSGCVQDGEEVVMIALDCADGSQLTAYEQAYGAVKTASMPAW